MLSALILPNSVPKKAFLKAESLGSIIFSEETYAELENVIQREKFDKYITLENRLKFVLALRNTALFFEINHKISDCRDPKDDKFLELALSENVKIIITGDLDLLGLSLYKTIPILTPAHFLNFI